MYLDKPVEELFKRATKQGLGKALKKGIVSSAAKDLKGVVFENSIIKNVVKGSGDWRYLQLEDGTERLVEKQVVRDLVRKAKTIKYGEMFDAKEPESQLVQAHKSLQIRMKSAHPDKSVILDYFNKYKQTLKLSGQDAPELSLAMKDNKYFSIPTKYARLLQKEKVLKILKDLM